MSIKGFSTSEKVLESVEGIPSEYTDSRANFVTLQEDRNNRVLLDTANKSAFKIKSDVQVSGQCTNRKIVAVNHGVKKGDLIRFVSGQNNYHEFNVKYVISANEFVVDGRMQNVPDVGDKFDVFVYLTRFFNISGAQQVSVVNSLTVFEYFFRDFELNPIINNEEYNITVSSPVYKINIINNSGGIFSLKSSVNEYVLVIGQGANLTLPFIFNTSTPENVILKNISGQEINSGKIFINFIKSI